MLTATDESDRNDRNYGVVVDEKKDAHAERPPTIYDVARRAGVSHQTVSRLLRGSAPLRPGTEARVTQALRELDYRPNTAARALSTGRSRRLTALTHTMSQVGPSAILQSASAVAREQGYVLDIIALNAHDTDSIAGCLRMIDHPAPAGFIALASTDELLAALAAARFAAPIHIIDAESANSTDLVSDLDLIAIPALIDHLAELGHRDVLHITGPLNWNAARTRAKAFERALTSRGIRIRSTVAGDWSVRSGYEAVRAEPVPGQVTAIVSVNDQMALGAIHALQEYGLHVPSDVSVVGMDDIPEAAFIHPPLTTVRLNFDALGRSAARSLIAQIESSIPLPRMLLTGEVVVRNSTGPARVRRPEDVGRLKVGTGDLRGERQSV